MTPTTAAGGRGRLTLSLYGLVACLAISQAGLGALLPFIRADLPMSLTVGSLHLSAMALGGLIASTMAEPLRHRAGRRGVLAAAFASGIAGGLGLAGAVHPAMSVGSLLVIGVAIGLSLITGQAAMSELHSARAPQMITELNLSYSLAAFASAIWLPLVAESRLGWRGYAVVPAIALVLLAVPALRSADRSERITQHRTGQQDPVGRRTRLAIATAGCCVAVEWLVAFWMATYLNEVLGFSKAIAAWGATGMLGAVLLGRALSSVLIGRVGARRVLALSLICVVLGFVAMQFKAVALVGGPVLGGLGIANLYPAAISLVVDTDRGRADLVMARCSLVTSTALLASPALAGTLADEIGLRRVLFLIPVFAGVALALLQVARRHGARSQAGG